MLDAELRGDEVTHAVDRFSETISRVQSNLRTRQSRLSQLIKLLGDRKVLVSSYNRT